MNNKRILLLKTLLLSTSRINKMRHSKDKKVKSKAIGGFVGLFVLYLMIMGYTIAACVGYGVLGLTSCIPVLCAATVSLLAFVFTFFKTNGYLFAFKEYDMLMSLPFETKTIAAVKFLYMYVVTLPWYLSISISMMIGYGIFAKPNAVVYLVWILLTLVIPVIPMLAASFIGFLIAKISSGFKQKNIIQTVLTFVFVILCFSLQYIIEALVKNDNTKEILENVSGSIEDMGRIYLPIQWFSDGVRDLNVLAMVLLILVTAAVFEVIFGIVAKYYRRINSALKSHAASKTYKMSSQKKHSVVNAIAYKEFKRLMGSQVYMVNGAMGEVLAVILGVVALFINFEKMMQVVLKGAPIPVESLFPAIPLIVYFLIGMVATTACSPSLEGKNYWILQSLPIEKKVIYQGKMLFNLYLTVPFAVFTTICFSISARVPFVNAIIYLVEVITLCCFSTAWGCVCGMKHMRLDWENEIEVVKQGTAVMLYLFPNMFVSMGMVVLVVALGMRMNANILSLAVTALALLLALLSYRKAMKLADAFEKR